MDYQYKDLKNIVINKALDMKVEVSSIATERLARGSQLLIGYMGIDMVITTMSCDR